MKRIAFTVFAVCILTLSSPAQEATVAAPNNYKVEFENDLVRVVRVTYAPHEKTSMHAHDGNATVIVVLKGGGRMRQVNEDGSIKENDAEKAGSVRFVPARKAYKHASENIGDSPIESIRVELKAPAPCGAKPAEQPSH